ncbi:MAG: hypothetical protein Q8S73_31895 [Deltaproteobacteria bacterium]|nr:hypothetical protein [Myxococcales bacterium]MDP3218750.1 hypothetical protein [Deltaproteobacteria bacterium]
MATSRTALWVVVAVLVTGVAGGVGRKSLNEAPLPANAMRKIEPLVGVYCSDAHHSAYFHGRGCGSFELSTSGDRFEPASEVRRANPEAFSRVELGCFEIRYLGYVSPEDGGDTHRAALIEGSTRCAFP